MKIIQYSNLGLSEILDNQSHRLSNQLLKISKTAGEARVAYASMNVFVSLYEIKCLLDSSKLTPMCPIEKFFQLSKAITSIGSTTFDSLTLLSKNKVLNPNKEACYDKTMSYFWTFNIFFCAGYSFYKLKQLQSDDKLSQKKNKPNPKTELQKKIYCIDIVSNLSDLFASLSGTGHLTFSKKVRGFGGTMAASTAIMNYKLNQKL